MGYSKPNKLQDQYEATGSRLSINDNNNNNNIVICYCALTINMLKGALHSIVKG